MSDSYYDAQDLGRFAEIGKDAPELWRVISSRGTPRCSPMAR